MANLKFTNSNKFLFSRNPKDVFLYCTDENQVDVSVKAGLCSLITETGLQPFASNPNCCLARA